MPPQENPLAQKSRTGLNRIWHATRYSLSGLKLGWYETSFRQEVILAAVLIPAAFWVGTTILETLLLIAVVMLLMIVELLNTCIESAIDRVGLQYHDLSKRAKDMGSAAVFLTAILLVITWLGLLYTRFFP